MKRKRDGLGKGEFHLRNKKSPQNSLRASFAALQIWPINLLPGVKWLAAPDKEFSGIGINDTL